MVTFIFRWWSSCWNS